MPAEGESTRKILEGMRQLIESNQQLTEQNQSLMQNVAIPQAQQEAEPKSLKEALGLDDTFVYDSEQAIQDPNSDSGRYRRAEIMLEVRRQGSEQREVDARDQALEDYRVEKKAFIAAHQMNETQWKAFEAKAANVPVSLEDLYLLQNKDRFAQNIARSTVDQRIQQRASMNQINPSLASSQGDMAPQPQTDDDLFNKMFKINNANFGSNI